VFVTYQLVKVKIHERKPTGRLKSRRLQHRAIKYDRFKGVVYQALDTAFLPTPFVYETTQKQSKLGRNATTKKASIHAKTQKTYETPAQAWEKARKTIKEILRQAQKAPSVQTVQKPSPTSHKS
jgi:hypothetical protein